MICNAALCDGLTCGGMPYHGVVHDMVLACDKACVGEIDADWTCQKWRD